MDKPQINISSYLFEVHIGAKARIEDIISFNIQLAETSLTFPFNTKYSPIRKRKIIAEENIVIGIIDKLYPSIKHSIGLSNITNAAYK